MDHMSGLYQRYLVLMSIRGNKGERRFGRKGKINTVKIGQSSFRKARGRLGRWVGALDQGNPEQVPVQ